MNMSSLINCFSGNHVIPYDLYSSIINFQPKCFIFLIVCKVFFWQGCDERFFRCIVSCYSSLHVMDYN